MEAPEYYRGIKVPETRKRYWDKPTMRAWREAIDATLDKVLEDMQEMHKDREANSPMWCDEWNDGCYYGRTAQMEDVVDHIKSLS